LVVKPMYPMTHAYATSEAATAITIINRTAMTGEIARIERLKRLPEFLSNRIFSLLFFVFKD
jgi:hypothetical protein